MMSLMSRRSSWTFALALSAGLAGTAQAGPVTILSAERTISAGIGDNDQRITSDSLGDFRDVVTASESAGGFAGTASASIDSTLGNAGLSHTGNLRYDVTDASADPSGNITMSVSTDVLFSIDRAHNFAFVFDLANEVGSVSATDNHIRLQGDNGVFISEEYSASGVLQPGTYRFESGYFAEKGTTLGDDLSFSVDYDIGLRLSAVDTGGGGPGGEPNPIPLPPAAWSGLAVLGAGLVARARRKLFA